MSSISCDSPITLAIIGAGQRGKAYAKYALKQPSKCKILAVAEPRPKTRAMMVATHNVAPSMTFDTYEDFVKASKESIAKGEGETRSGKGRLVDGVVVAVQDAMHVEVVLKMAELGYHILCEKPLATTPEDCIKMADAVRESGKIFGIGHVLRYSPYNKAIAEVIKSRALGDIVNITHLEPVGHFHFAHSYVRGAWHREETSSFTLMTKSCHDIDILNHYLGPSGSKPVRVSSFGSLSHFRKSAKPQAAGDATKCLECPIQDSCPYSAKKIYLDPVSKGNLHWPASVIVDGIPDIENIGDALQKGPYGQCVYESSNDVVDHQVVNLEYSGGQTCSFTMVAFTSLICDRQTRIHFTHGELIGNMNTFTTTDFSKLPIHGTSAADYEAFTKATVLHTPEVDEMSGHGGGDEGLIKTFVEAVRMGKQELMGVDVGDVLESHLTVFAAESSRKEGRVVNVQEYEKNIRDGMASTHVSV